MGSTLAAFKSRFQNRPRNDREQTDVEAVGPYDVDRIGDQYLSLANIFKAGDGLHNVISCRIGGSKALPIGNQLRRFLLLQESTA